MTKTEIYNIALKQHGKKCTQAEVESENPPYEVELCNTYYASAVRKVLAEWDWAFLLYAVDTSLCIDAPEGKWRHGFCLPNNTLRVAKISTKPYQIIRGKFMTDSDNPDLYVIKDDFDCTDAPDGICNLIGIALAYELCGLLAPVGSPIIQTIAQNYNWILKPLTESEPCSYIRDIEEGGAVVY